MLEVLLTHPVYYINTQYDKFATFWKKSKDTVAVAVGRPVR